MTQKEFESISLKATKGDLDSILKLADCLSEGIGCNQDIPRAITLYLETINRGSSIGANNLATMYRDLKDYAKAFQYYNISCELDSKTHQRTIFSLSIGLCYYLGIGTEKNVAKSIEVFENILDNDDVNSQYDVDEANYMLGVIYIEGIYVQKDIKIARCYLSKADEESDHHAAQHLLLIIGR